MIEGLIAKLFKDILDKITKEAIGKLERYGNKAEFLKELALYIQNRDK